MSIVERLQFTAQIRARHRDDSDPIRKDCEEAADLIISLKQALGQAQQALLMMIEPNYITGSSVVNAFAAATAAEANARKVLEAA